MTNSIDKLYDSLEAKPGSFVFDKRVADVFTDMISRSVPGYQQILEMLPTLARQFYFPQHNYYDLGCSLGAGLLAMSEGLKNANANLVGVDNSEAMIEKAKTNLSGFNATIIEDDLRSIPIKKAGMVLMNFTLQFIPIEYRNSLVQEIYNGLVQGGALGLSEKIQFDDPKTNLKLTEIHHQYKADQGYSEMEIAKKRDAIIDVLIPETLDEHSHRLRNTGFSVVTPWVQNLQFVSILAVK